MTLEQLKKNHEDAVARTTQFYQAYCETMGASKVYAMLITQMEEDALAEEVLDGNKENPKK